MTRQDVSAQVILRSPLKDVPITAHNVLEAFPSAEIVNEVVGFFKERGFSVGDVVATSFSITGRPELFETLFEQQIRFGEERGMQTAQVRDGGLEFDTTSLPEPVRQHIGAVSFTPPPDFGPGNP